MADVTIAGGTDVPEGEMRGHEADGHAIAVANVGGSLRAFRNECTHMHCTLDDGELDDGRVVCACHGSAFDLETGAVENPPATEPIDVYPAREEGDDLIVMVE